MSQSEISNTFILDIIQLIILIVTLLVIYYLTKKQIKNLNESTDRQIINLNKSTDMQIKNLNQSTDKQIEKLDKNNIEQIEVLNKSSLKTVENLKSISNELKNTNLKLEDTIKKMDIVAEAMKTQSKLIPDLIILERDFKGNIVLRKNIQYKLRFWVRNNGVVPAQETVINFKIEDGLNINKLKRYEKKAIKTEYPGRFTLLQFFFKDELIMSNAMKGITMVDVIGKKSGTYKIEWSVQCISQPLKEGEFIVTIN